MAINVQTQPGDQGGAQEAVRHHADRLVLVVGLSMAFILISSTLHLSEQVGRLSRPPGYDDVVYMLEGFTFFERFLQGGPIGAFLALFGQHAPLQSLLALLGYWIFGVSAWSVYAIDGVLVTALVLVILWIGRSLRPLVRLALVVAALCCPVTVNLVAEFRPDLYWGLLCGIAVYLILDPSFLAAPRRYQLVAAVVTALALLAKPSAVAGTAFLLGVALLVALGLRRLDGARILTGSRRERNALLLFASAVVVIAGPFFAINAADIYSYNYVTLVTKRDLLQQVGSFWFHLGFFAIGPAYRIGLYGLFWVGIVALLLNARRFWIERDRPGGLRYAGYAAVVLVAYVIPSALAVKTYHLGGIFYGTFLIFTIHGLALIFGDLQRRVSSARRVPTTTLFSAEASPAISLFGGALALYAVSLLSIAGLPLASVYDRSQSADLWKVDGHIVDALAKSEAPRGAAQVTTVYVPAPVPITATYLSLMGRWRRLNMVGVGGYYLRTLPEHERVMQNVDFVVLSEDAGGLFPGALLSPQLLELVKGRKDFEAVLTYIHPDRRKTYLFRRVAPPH